MPTARRRFGALIRGAGINGEVCLDEETRSCLRVGRGDVVTVMGNRQTVAVVSADTARAVGENGLGLDPLVAENARVLPGDFVVLSKAAPRAARKVYVNLELETSQPGAPFWVRANGSKLLAGRYVSRGDRVLLPRTARKGRDLRLTVVGTEPQGPVRVTQRTAVLIFQASEQGPRRLSRVVDLDRERSRQHVFERYRPLWTSLSG